MKIFKIAGKLFFASFMISVTAPKLELNHILFALVVDDEIHAFIVPSPGFYAVISDTIDNRFQEQDKIIRLFDLRLRIKA